MAGTPFERSRTPLQKWFYAMYLFTTSRHGVPAKELQRQLGVTYKTAWRMGHEIRKYMARVDGDDGLSGHVEIDETYVGGRRRGKPGHPSIGKAVVFGMVERGGDVMAYVIDKATGRKAHARAGRTLPFTEAFLEGTEPTAFSSRGLRERAGFPYPLQEYALDPEEGLQVPGNPSPTRPELLEFVESLDPTEWLGVDGRPAGVVWFDSSRRR